MRSLAVKTVDALGEMAQYNEARFAAMDARFAVLDERFGLIDTRFSAIESRFVAVDARLRGIDLRIGDLKDDLQLMIKSELMSALGNFETRMVGLIDERLGGKN